MLRAYLISYPVLVFFWSVLASWGGLTVYDEINFSNDEVAIDLSDSIHPIEVLEYSDGLSEWVPVSRNYGNGWETIFPYSYSLESGVLSIPKGNEGFLRKRFESSEQNYSAMELVSEFLMQATFGPNLNSIVTFPNVSDPNFHNNQYVNFEIWIDEQISKTPFSHRAYWRQRSDPAFTDASSQTGYLENEVGHDASLGQRLPFYRGTVKYATDNSNPLPGYGGLFDINGDPIDPNLHSNNLDYRGIPKLGFHIENSITQTGSSWDVMGLNANDTEKLVWFEAAINAEDQLRQRGEWALSQCFVVG